MDKKSKQYRKDALLLIKRTENHLTLTESEQYQLSCPDELMEYLWLKPEVTQLNVDVFVDDGGSYKRNGHKLLLFARNSYDRSSNEFIPFSIEHEPFVMNDEIEFNISYDDIFDIQEFIQKNEKIIILLSNQEITQDEFFSKIIKKVRLVAENVSRLDEMSTLRKDESKLPVDIWLDEGATYQGHAPRIKFRASSDQHRTEEYSSMLIVNPPVIENLPKNCPIRKKDMDKIKKICDR